MPTVYGCLGWKCPALKVILHHKPWPGRGSSGTESELNNSVTSRGSVCYSLWRKRGGDTVKQKVFTLGRPCSVTGVVGASQGR